MICPKCRVNQDAVIDSRELKRAPAPALEPLIQQWRKHADVQHKLSVLHPGVADDLKHIAAGQAYARRECADELEAALGSRTGSPESRLDRIAADPRLRVKGWDTYGAEPLTDAAVAAMRRFLAYAGAIVPTNCGGLQIEWHAADVDLELEFDEHGRPSAAFAQRASDGASLTDEIEEVTAGGSPAPDPHERTK